jgi:Yip1 domain
MRTIFTIWTKPRKTFEYLDKCDSEDLEWDLNYLFYLGALSILIPRMVDETKHFGNHQIVSLIIISLLSAFIGALFLKYIYAIAIWIIGRALQGQASRFQIRIVIAYFMVPGLISLILSIVLIVVAIIYKDINIIAYQNWFTQFIIWIFGLRTLIIGIAKFNKFSYGYALINIILFIGLFQGIIFAIKYLVH